MPSFDIFNPNDIISHIVSQAKVESVRVTLHAHQEMVKEEIDLDDVLSALTQARLIENYPNHERGPCCLICGKTKTGDYLHVVCTTSLDTVVIITVYKPKKPKWITPFQRGNIQYEL